MKASGDAATPEAKSHRRLFVIVVVVLGTVVMLALPRQIICGIRSSPGVKAITDTSAILQSLTEYAINNSGRYPSSLEPLVAPDLNGHCYLEGYNGAVPKDPWKRAYHYEAPTPAYPRPHVWSYGADGRLGGTGDDADIDSEELRESDR